LVGELYTGSAGRILRGRMRADGDLVGWGGSVESSSLEGTKEERWVVP